MYSYVRKAHQYKENEGVNDCLEASPTINAFGIIGLRGVGFRKDPSRRLPVSVGEVAPKEKCGGRGDDVEGDCGDAGVNGNGDRADVMGNGGARGGGDGI